LKLKNGIQIRELMNYHKDRDIELNGLKSEKNYSNCEEMISTRDRERESIVQSALQCELCY
jgi:hypothetical protein